MAISWAAFLLNLQLVIVFLILSWLIKKLIEICINEDSDSKESKEKIEKLDYMFKQFVVIFSCLLVVAISTVYLNSVVGLDLSGEIKLNGLQRECRIKASSWRIDVAIVECDSTFDVETGVVEKNDISKENDHFFYFGSKPKMIVKEIEEKKYYVFKEGDRQNWQVRVEQLKEDKNYFYIEGVAFYGSTGMPLFNSKDGRVVGVFVGKHDKLLMFAKTYSYDFLKMFESEKVADEL